jgi:hypothetical protein
MAEPAAGDGGGDGGGNGGGNGGGTEGGNESGYEGTVVEVAERQGQRYGWLAGPRCRHHQMQTGRHSDWQPWSPPMWRLISRRKPSPSAVAWLAQSVERLTLKQKQSKGCGFDPRIGLSFCTTLLASLLLLPFSPSPLLAFSPSFPLFAPPAHNPHLISSRQPTESTTT